MSYEDYIIEYVDRYKFASANFLTVDCIFYGFA